MKNSRLVRVFVSVVLCMVFMAMPAGNAYAMPFNAAVNYAVGTNPRSVAVGDFNRDGNPDLAVANYNSNDVSILLGNGLGAFAPKVDYTAGTNPVSVAVGDFNRDGNPDLAVANYTSDNVSILLGNGLGAFAPAVNYTTGTNPVSVAVGDFNRDGNPDLAVANNDSDNVSILLGNGLGAFAPKVDYTAGTNPFSVAVGDFNRDGNPDLAVANFNSNNVSILLGNGLGAFAAAVNYAVVAHPSSVAMGDFNRDGNPDLAVANYNSDNVSILLNTPEPPTITSVNPASGIQGQTLPVVITGTKFAGPTTVSFGTGITVNSVTVDNLTQVITNISIAGGATSGAHNVSVTTIGGTATLTGGFTVNLPAAPTITSVNPASGIQGQTLTVVITGTKFAGPTIVSFGTGITVNNLTVNSLTQITANISIDANAAAGARSVSVTTPGGIATLTGGLTVIEVQQNPLIGTNAPTSHGSSMSGTTTTTQPVGRPKIMTQSASLSAKTVTPGTPVTVTANLINKSAVNGNKKVTLYVNGQVETTQGVTVNSGGSSKLTFNVSRSEPGDYSVYVDGVPAGSFKVELFRESDAILIFSAALVALAFLIGMFLLWRRQRTG